MISTLKFTLATLLIASAALNHLPGTSPGPTGGVAGVHGESDEPTEPPSASSDTASSRILELTGSTWDKSIIERQLPLSEQEQGTAYLVKWYTTWCGHCQAMEADWLALADELAGEPFQLAQVDVGAERELSDDYGITGFPTIQLFYDGAIRKYTGSRDFLSMASWARAARSPVLTPLLTALDSLRATRQAKEDPSAWPEPNAQTVMEGALKLVGQQRGPDSAVAIVMVGSSARYSLFRQVASASTDAGTPVYYVDPSTIVLPITWGLAGGKEGIVVAKGDGAKWSTKVFDDSPQDESAISEWLERAKRMPLPMLSELNYGDLTGDAKVRFVLTVLEEDLKEESDALRAAVKSISLSGDYDGKFTFAWVPAETFAAYLVRFTYTAVAPEGESISSTDSPNIIVMESAGGTNFWPASKEIKVAASNGPEAVEAVIRARLDAIYDNGLAEEKLNLEVIAEERKAKRQAELEEAANKFTGDWYIDYYLPFRFWMEANPIIAGTLFGLFVVVVLWAVFGEDDEPSQAPPTTGGKGKKSKAEKRAEKKKQ